MTRIPFTLTGASNFRDLGGYRSASGQVTRHRRLLRSDHLGNLGPQDISLLATHLGEAVRVLDLRGVAEREAAACAIPGATVHSLPIEPTIVQKLTDAIESGEQLTAGDTVALMQETYRNFVRSNTPRFAALFEHALAFNDAPLVFHCTAGKDRTGLAAALLLRALDVAQEDVMRDYLITNERFKPPVPAGDALSREVLQVLWRVQPDFLHAAFDTIDEHYGSLEAYFREGLALRAPERERLRELYLAPEDR
jgi:protein-tyrosine phosphatase